MTILPRSKRRDGSCNIMSALDNGAPEGAAEVLTNWAFYASWPFAMSGAQVAIDVSEKRDA